MQCHAVAQLHVHAFDDVDFSGFRPVGAHGPEGRPCPAYAAGHVGEVQDDQAMRVRLFTSKSHARSPGSACHVRVVDAHVDGPVARADQPATLRCALINVCHVAVGWVGVLFRWLVVDVRNESICHGIREAETYGKEVEHGKKVAIGIVIFQHITSCAEGH